MKPPLHRPISMMAWVAATPPTSTDVTPQNAWRLEMSCGVGVGVKETWGEKGESDKIIKG
jgi:hypothetical protein